MGLALSPQITTIGSSDPARDADFLQQAFPIIPFSRENAGNGDFVFLMAANTERTLVFQRITGSSPTQIVWIVKPDELDTLDSARERTVLSTGESCQLSMMKLPGGSTVVLITPNVMETKEGRQWYAQALKKCTTRFTTADDGTPVTTTRAGELPNFRMLSVSLQQQNGDFLPYPVNSPTAIPFESDLFIGKMILALRPEDPSTDDYWGEIFSKKKRRFILQLQGKFKRKPRGVLFAGGEVSDPMKVGLVAKGMCTILLNLMRSSGMHYSFGDKNERSHIVFPAWIFFERITVTDPGNAPPPPMGGEPFPETKDSIDRRRSSDGGVIDWKADGKTCYSFEFFTQYLDLPSWQIVNVPVTKDIDLRTFWGNSFLNIVLYENTTPLKDERHLVRSYLFSVRMQYFPNGKDEELSQTSEEMERTLPWNMRTRRVDSIADFRFTIDETESPSGSAIMEEYDTHEFFFDAEEEDSTSPSLRQLQIASTDTPLGCLCRIDLLCPMRIEMCSEKGGKYTDVFAFNTRIKDDGEATIFRASSSVSQCFEGYMDEANRSLEDYCSPRLASDEKMRRLAGQAFAMALESTSSRIAGELHRFQTERTEFDVKFLKRTEPSLSEKQNRLMRRSCFVARALSDRHWIEEWAKIAGFHISFYHVDKPTKCNFRLSLNGIVNVRNLEPEACPYLASMYYFMAIETRGRTIYLMFASSIDRDDWVAYLTQIVGSTGRSLTDTISIGSESRGSVTSDYIIAVDDPTDEFLHKSSMFNCKQRRILNCRKLCFRAKEHARNANNAVEDALSKVLEPRSDSEEENLRAFLDSAAMLKEVDVDSLGEQEKLAFFLNLYHLVIMHSFLVLGPPETAFHWASYFNTISYHVGDDILSLTELEHCVIRAKMNYPTNFLSRFVLPKSQFRFALTEADFRINFALNSGSLSNPPVVPVYKVDVLDKQLDMASRAYLEAADVVVKRNTTVVTLPRICQWFADDFGKNGSTTQLLKAVEPFLRESHRKSLSCCWSTRESRYTDVSVKYLPYSFECRYLSLSE